MDNNIKANINNSQKKCIELKLIDTRLHKKAFSKRTIENITTHPIYSKNRKLMKYVRLYKNARRPKGNKKRYFRYIITIIESINTKINTQTDRNTLAQKYGNKSYNKTMSDVKNNSGKCYLTNKKQNLVVHHINSVDKHPEMIVDESNLVVITDEVHKYFHKQFGYGNNNKSQWDKFVKNYKII